MVTSSGMPSIAISEGSWIRPEMLEMPEPPSLDDLPLATAVPEPLPPLEGFTFEGYRNADGSTGTRNILGITTTVQCVAPTVDYAVRRIKSEVLPQYPNVDDVVAITHTYGCGVAIDAPGAAIPIRTIRNLTYHPNIGGRADDRQSRMREAAAAEAVSLAVSRARSGRCRSIAGPSRVCRDRCGNHASRREAARNS